MTKQKYRTTTLGEELPLKYGKARRGDIGVKSKATPVYGSSGIFDTFERRLTNGPTLIVGRKGSVGSIFLTSEGCWPIDTVFFAEPKEGQYLPYFKYLLEGLKLKNLDRSTAVPGLSRDDYNKIKVSIPEYETQKAITEEIETQFTRLDAGVAALKRAQANLKRYRAAALKAACEGKLVPTEAELAKKEGRSYETGEQLLQRILAERRKKWETEQKKSGGKKKYVEPKGPDVSSLPKLPKGWAWVSFDQVCQSISDEGKKIPKSEYQIKGRYPIIDQGEDQIGGYTDDRSLVYEGILPIIIFGDHTRRFKLYAEPFVIGADGVKLIGKSDAWVIKYLWYQFQQLLFEDRGYSRHFQFVRNTALRLPPLDEQIRIAEEIECRLSALDKQEENIAEKIKMAGNLRNAILKQLIEGE